jgi:hypothetical protein
MTTLLGGLFKHASSLTCTSMLEIMLHTSDLLIAYDSNIESYKNLKLKLETPR